MAEEIHNEANNISDIEITQNEPLNLDITAECCLETDGSKTSGDIETVSEEISSSKQNL